MFFLRIFTFSMAICLPLASDPCGEAGEGPSPCLEALSPCQCLDHEPHLLTLNDIIEQTFSNNLEIVEQYQNIENSMGIWKQQAGRFDTNLFARFSRLYLRDPVFFQDFIHGKAPLFVVEDKARIAATDLELSLERRLRSGLLIRPSIHVQRLDNDFQVPRVQTTGNLQVTFELPLLRNQGYENIGAGEIAASIAYRASILIFKNEAARVIATVGKAYWQYIYTAERLRTFELAYERTKEFLIGLEKLIAAGEVAATEAHQVRTDLETRRANIERASQELFKAKQALMVLMNIDPEYYNCYKINQKPFEYPDAEEVAKINCEIVDLWIQYALTQRSDYIAYHLYQEASLVLVNQAINALEPELNVAFDIFTNGLEDGRKLAPYIESFNRHVKGVNIKGTISLSSPLCHTFERGVLQSRRSELRRLQAQTMQLLNNIKADIVSRASAIRHYREEVEALTIATREAEQAVIDEIRKFQLGASTVFDIIQLKDRALNTQLSLIEAKLNYVNVLIELRFLSGAILHPDQPTCHIDEHDLVALPRITINSPTRTHPLE